MLPHSYDLVAALVLVLAGALACFTGHRLFRIVLAIFGFIIGAMLASSMMGISNTAGMLAAALVGGALGAIVLMLAYFLGIALVGAGVGALIAHLGWGYLRAGDPPVALVIALAIGGAVAAMFLQRYVIIVTTAFVGAWTLLVGALAAAGDRGASGGKLASDVWILYPTTPGPGHEWMPIAWVAIGLIGMAVQLGVTGKR
jgi:hypothetical protein